MMLYITLTRREANMVFQNLPSRSKSRRGEMATRRNTNGILRIGQLAPTPDLDAGEGFETASNKEGAHVWGNSVTAKPLAT